VWSFRRLRYLGLVRHAVLVTVLGGVRLAHNVVLATGSPSR
jgi:hypothetical protein